MPDIIYASRQRRRRTIVVPDENPVPQVPDNIIDGADNVIDGASEVVDGG